MEPLKAVQPAVRPQTDLIDDIVEAAAGIKNGSECGFGKILKKLSDKEREDLIGALPKYPATAIAAALKKRNHVIQGPAIARHRRGACSCGGDTR